MSIQSELTRIMAARDDSLAVVESKGVVVPSNATIDSLPNLISQIQAGASDYEDLINKPQINGYTLSSNQSAAELELASDDIIAIQSAQPSSDTNKLWIYEEDSEGIEIPTVTEARSLGIIRASVGDIVFIKAVDSNGVPTSYESGPYAVVMPSSAIAIPSSGSSVSYHLTGITENHRLIQWNFVNNGVSIEEYKPPCDLSWATYSGYFTISNNGGVTSATIQPLFSIPVLVATTVHS